MIRDIADETTGRAKIDEVIELVSRHGFSRDEIKKQIELFLRQGEAMEPKSGVIKLI